MPKKRLALLVGFVFIDVLGYSLFFPLLPYYAAIFGAGPALVTSGPRTALEQPEADRAEEKAATGTPNGRVKRCSRCSRSSMWPRR